MVGIRHAPQLEIHVESEHDGLVLIRGSAYESPSLVLKGTVEIRAQDTVSARKLRLKLVGVHRLDFHHLDESSHDAHPTMVAVREDATVLECKWGDLLTSPDGRITKQFHGHDQPDHDDPDHHSDGASTGSAHGTPSGSAYQSPSASYTNLFHLGTSPTPNNASSHHHHHHHIPQGTHQIPFQIVLPGDIPETVEGLGSGSVLYHLEAMLEKPTSTFKTSVVKQKYLRIMRTMSTDALAMSETMFIGSTWPGKVQYEFSVPSKAIAIGSTTPVHILLVPLVKGITLGPIKAQVIQQYLLKSAKDKTRTFSESQVVVESKMDEHEGTVLMDTMKLDSEIKIPDVLKLVTPQCDLPGDIVKVRHKIKLQITLKNPDGHLSELRTNLPVTMFVSPHIPVKSRRVELDKTGKVYFLRDSEPLFEGGSSTPGSPIGFVTVEENESLPSYGSHVYDQVFTPVGTPDGGMSPMGSLPNSGFATPMPRPQLVAHHIDDYFSIPTSSSPTISSSPMLTPSDHTMHLREQLQKLSFERMSQVPTYDEAIHSDTPNSPDLEFSPEYEPEDHYQLNDTSGLTITTTRRRHTDNHSNGQRPIVHPGDAHIHLHHPHSPVPIHQMHHQPSPLRSVASTTNLLSSHQQHQVHSHSPLAPSKNSISTSNLSKLIGMKMLNKNSSGVSLKR